MIFEPLLTDTAASYGYLQLYRLLLHADDAACAVDTAPCAVLFDPYCSAHRLKLSKQTGRDLQKIGVVRADDVHHAFAGGG